MPACAPVCTHVAGPKPRVCLPWITCARLQVPVPGICCPMRNLFPASPPSSHVLSCHAAHRAWACLLASLTPHAMTCSLLPPHHFHPQASSADQTLSKSISVRGRTFIPASQGRAHLAFSIRTSPAYHRQRQSFQTGQFHEYYTRV